MVAWDYSTTSSRPPSRSGARGEAQSAGGNDGADDASPVARLASQELSPSITPCPSCPPADRGICGVAPGSVGVGPVGAAVVAPGPLEDFRLHVFRHTKRAPAISEKNAR